ncbi:MAG: uroporphyrinogen-III synthase, partial [Citricoccus sp.]|nr:uroporphyrinogen-III synthase [Citricoccus sp. WCRC_4]
MTGRVVMTRQPAQAGDVETGLREAGWAVQFLPLTDFELPADLTDLHAAVDRLRAGGYAWLVATSPNTVRSLARAGWDGSLPAATRVAVTGPGTARVLAGAGCTATAWMPDGDASAAGIIAGFPAGPGGAPALGAGGHRDAAGTTGAAARVFLPQSALATDDVAEALRSRGWDVQRVEAYRTVPYPAAPERRLLARTGTARATDGPGGAVVGIQDLPGAVIVLTSPSAVRELSRQLPGRGPAGARFVAIGRPTRRAAEKAGIELIGTAASP